MMQHQRSTTTTDSGEEEEEPRASCSASTAGGGAAGPPPHPAMEPRQQQNHRVGGGRTAQDRRKAGSTNGDKRLYFHQFAPPGEDPLVEWLRREYVFFPDKTGCKGAGLQEWRVAISDLYSHYRQGYCRSMDEEPKRRCEFGKFVRKAFPDIRVRRLGPANNQVPFYCGLVLRERWDAEGLSSSSSISADQHNSLATGEVRTSHVEDQDDDEDVADETAREEGHTTINDPRPAWEEEEEMMQQIKMELLNRRRDYGELPPSRPGGMPTSSSQGGGMGNRSVLGGATDNLRPLLAAYSNIEPGWSTLPELVSQQAYIPATTTPTPSHTLTHNTSSSSLSSLSHNMPLSRHPSDVAASFAAGVEEVMSRKRKYDCLRQHHQRSPPQYTQTHPHSPNHNTHTPVQQSPHSQTLPPQQQQPQHAHQQPRWNHYQNPYNMQPFPPPPTQQPQQRRHQPRREGPAVPQPPPSSWESYYLPAHAYNPHSAGSSAVYAAAPPPLQAGKQPPASAFPYTL